MHRSNGRDSPRLAEDMWLKMEQEEYRDIVQGDFIENYYNLTWKVQTYDPLTSHE